jgi:hypothetical protein
MLNLSKRAITTRLVGGAIALMAIGAAQAGANSEYFLKGLELSVSTGELTAVEYVKCELVAGVAVEHSIEASITQQQPTATVTAIHTRGPAVCVDGVTEVRTVLDTSGQFLPDAGLPVSEIIVDTVTSTCFIESDVDEDEDEDGQPDRVCIHLTTEGVAYNTELVP